MAQFRGTLCGQSGRTVSRLGGTITGLEATVNGWHAGVRVMAYRQDGHDYFKIFRTSGSVRTHPDEEIAVVTDKCR